MAQGLSDLALEVAHAGFARVVLDDVAERLVGDLDLLRLQAVCLQSAGAPGSAGRSAAFRRPCSRRA